MVAPTPPPPPSPPPPPPPSSSSSNCNVPNAVCRPPPAPTAPFRPNRLSTNNSTNTPPPVTQSPSVSVPVALSPQQQDLSSDLLSTACERLNKIARTLRAQVETKYDRIGGQDHCPLFSATITLLPQRYTATATGPSKMASRRAASLQILNILGDKAATYDPRRVRTPRRENGRIYQSNNLSGAGPSNVSSLTDTHNNNNMENKDKENHIQSTPSSSKLSKSIPFVIDRKPDPDLMFVLENSSNKTNMNEKQIKKEVIEVISKTEKDKEKTTTCQHELSPPIPRKKMIQNDDVNKLEQLNTVAYRSSDKVLTTQPRSTLSISESKHNSYVRRPRSSQRFIRSVPPPSQRLQSTPFHPKPSMIFPHQPISSSTPSLGHHSPQSPNINVSNIEFNREAIISRSRGVVTKYQPSADPRKAAKAARQEAIKRRETDTNDTNHGKDKIPSYSPSSRGTKDTQYIDKSNSKSSNMALHVSKPGEKEMIKEPEKHPISAQTHVKGTSEPVHNPLRSATKPQILKDQSNNTENKRLEVTVTQPTNANVDIIKHTIPRKSTPSDKCVTSNRGNSSTNKMQPTLAKKDISDSSPSAIHKPMATSKTNTSSNPTTTNVPSSTVIQASAISNTQSNKKTIAIPPVNKTLNTPSPDATSVGSSSSHFTPESSKTCETRLKSDETTQSKEDSSTRKVIQESAVTNGTPEDSLEEGEVVDDMRTRSMAKAQDNSPVRTSGMATRSSGKKNDPADSFENVVRISPNLKLRVKCSTPEELAQKKRQKDEEITPMNICNGNEKDEVTAANVDKARKDDNAESRKTESSKSKNGRHASDSHSTDDKKISEEDKIKKKEKKDKSKGRKEKAKGKKDKRGNEEDKMTDESGSTEPLKKIINDAFTEINGLTSNNRVQNGSSSRSNQRSTGSGSAARSVTGSVGQGHKKTPSQEKQKIGDESIGENTKITIGEGNFGHGVIHHPAISTSEEIPEMINTIQLPKAGLPFAKRKRTYYQSLEATNGMEEDSGEELAARPPRKRAKRELPEEQKRVRLMIFCDYENDFSRKALDELVEADLALDMQIVVASRVERDSFVNLPKGTKAEVLDIPPFARSHPGVLATSLAFAVGAASQEMWVQRAQHVANGGSTALWPRILIIHPNPVLGALRKPGVIEVVHPNHDVVEAVRTMIDRAIEEAENQ